MSSLQLPFPLKKITQRHTVVIIVLTNMVMGHICTYSQFEVTNWDGMFTTFLENYTHLLHTITVNMFEALEKLVALHRGEFSQQLPDTTI